MPYQLSLRDAFLESCSKYPDKNLLIFNDSNFSYSDALIKASRVAYHLQENGIRKGDRVCIFLENQPECVFSILATILCGACFSVVDHNLKNEKINFILKNSEAKLIITDSRKNKIDAKFQTENNITVLDNVTELVESPTERVQQPVIIPTDLASIIYTSGSTGQPKGVIHTHLSMSFAAQSISSYLSNRSDDTIISALPLSFDYGLYQLIMCFFFGGTLVLERNFVFPSKLFEKIERYRCTGLPIVPSLCSSINKADSTKFDLSSIRYITNTAAHLDEKNILEVQQKFSSASIYSMYGLTECKRVSFLPPDLIHRKPNSVGIPIPDTEVKILREDGNLYDNGTGELVVRGPHIMSGYWKNEIETRKKIFVDRLTNEKFLKTGDIFRVDDDGFLYFLSRKDEVVKVKSKKASLFEIEEKIKETLSIKEICAIAIPDSTSDNRIIVFYSTDEVAQFTSEMHQKVRSVLEPHCIPSEYVATPKIPKSTNGKNDKNILKSRLYSATEHV